MGSLWADPLGLGSKFGVFKCYWDWVVSAVGRKNVINRMDMELWMESSEFWCKFHFYMVHPKLWFYKTRAVPRISVQSLNQGHISLLSKWSQRAQSEPPKGSVPEKGRSATIFQQLPGFLIPNIPVELGEMYPLACPQRENLFEMFYINQVFSIVWKLCFELELKQFFMLLNYLDSFSVLVHFDGHSYF